ncbi:MAG TPA: VOC family protein [Polyangiaceae bacterium]
MANAVNWFEIPVADLDRAARFYERALDIRLKREVFGSMQLAVFPYAGPAVGGALAVDKRRKPSQDGALVYLNAAGQLDAVLDRVAEAGGSILVQKTDIGDPGFIALVRDTEGNVVGFHSPREANGRS